MKKVVLIIMSVFLALAFTQCKSKEDKALALIDDYMFKTLYDYESYQPVETKIDSAFHTFYNDSVINVYAYIVLKYQEEYDEARENFHEAESMMDIWSGSLSSYGRDKWDDAVADAKTY